MEKLTVNEFTNERIDKYINKNYPDLTRSLIKKSIENGNILCNQKNVKPSYKIKQGDIIDIIKNFERKTNKLIKNKAIPIKIVYENKDFIIVNKQKNLQVHPDYINTKNTLVNAIISKYPQIKTIGNDNARPGIVHRLDKNTSGLIIIAKTNNAFDEFKRQFKQREVKKTYLAITWSKPKEKNGIIETYIARSKKYTRQKIVEKIGKNKTYKGQPKIAITRYEVIKSWYDYNLDSELSLIELKPQTGRMHQLRIHLKYIGTPILGDTKYETKITKQKNKLLFEKYQTNSKHNYFYLCAYKLSFKFLDKSYTFRIELPEYFEELLKAKNKITF